MFFPKTIHFDHWRLDMPHGRYEGKPLVRSFEQRVGAPSKRQGWIWIGAAGLTLVLGSSALWLGRAPAEPSLAPQGMAHAAAAVTPPTPAPVETVAAPEPASTVVSEAPVRAETPPRAEPVVPVARPAPAPQATRSVAMTSAPQTLAQAPVAAVEPAPAPVLTAAPAPIEAPVAKPVEAPAKSVEAPPPPASGSSS